MKSIEDIEIAGKENYPGFAEILKSLSQGMLFNFDGTFSAEKSNDGFKLYPDKNIKLLEVSSELGGILTASHTYATRASIPFNDSFVRFYLFPKQEERRESCSVVGLRRGKLGEKINTSPIVATLQEIISPFSLAFESEFLRNYGPEFLEEMQNSGEYLKFGSHDLADNPLVRFRHVSHATDYYIRIHPAALLDFIESSSDEVSYVEVGKQVYEPGLTVQFNHPFSIPFCARPNQDLVAYLGLKEEK